MKQFHARTHIFPLLILSALVSFALQGGVTHSGFGQAADQPDIARHTLGEQPQTAALSLAESPSESHTVDTKDAWRVQLLGHLGGYAGAVAVQGNYAYLGLGRRLVILDIKNPSQPEEISQTEYLPGMVIGIALAGNYAYIAAGGLSIFEISDPARPQKIRYFEGSPTHLELAGSYLYVIGNSYDDNEISILEISDPILPREVGSYRSLAHIYDVAAVESHVFLATGEFGLRIIDVSIPSAPVEVGFFKPYPNPYIYSANQVILSGNYAYLDYGGLPFILDVSNPAAPVEIGSYQQLLCTIASFAVTENLLYIRTGCSQDGLKVISISNPAAPYEIGYLEMPGTSRKMALLGNLLFTTDPFGLHLIDISTPADPQIIGSFHGPNTPYAATVSDNYAYLADTEAGLRIIDISDPTAPFETGYSPIDTWTCHDVALTGHYAYVAGSWLHIIDITDPSAPIEIGTVYDVSYPVGVEISGDYAYVADSNGLWIFDISDPAAPTQTALFPSQPTGITVSGGYAYLTIEFSYFEKYLQIIDISNPYVPVEVFWADYWIDDIAVSGQFAYTASYGGLAIFDISNPAAPAGVGGYAYNAAVRPQVVIASENSVYVTTQSGVSVIDVSNPAAPVEIGYYNLYTDIYPDYGLGSDGEVAYFGNRDGLFIFRYLPYGYYLPAVQISE